MRRSTGVLVALVLACLVGLVGGRAMSAEAGARVFEGDDSIAVCAVPKLVNELMNSDRFAPERERVRDDFNDRIRDVEDEAREIAQKYEGQQPNPEDGQVQADQRRFQELMQRAEALRREATVEFERLTAEHILESYELARSAAGAVAEELGYSFVIASVEKDEELVEGDTQTAIRQMMARPMIVYPERADITEDVRAELRL